MDANWITGRATGKGRAFLASRRRGALGSSFYKSPPPVGQIVICIRSVPTSREEGGAREVLWSGRSLCGSLFLKVIGEGGVTMSTMDTGDILDFIEVGIGG